MCATYLLEPFCSAALILIYSIRLVQALIRLLSFETKITALQTSNKSSYLHYIFGIICSTAIQNMCVTPKLQ